MLRFYAIMAIGNPPGGVKSAGGRPPGEIRKNPLPRIGSYKTIGPVCTPKYSVNRPNYKLLALYERNILWQRTTQ